MCEPLCEQRDFIIEAALVYVPFYGWSWKALEKAGVDLANDAILARRLFTSDLSLAADHFADWSDRRMKTELEKVDLMAMRVRERIHTCVKIRIALNSPNKEAIRRLLSFLSLPHNAGLVTRITWRSCSAIWYAIGDRSTDWNYYSKRAILASVYLSTIMYWLSDEGNESGDFPETWAFLDRRIDNVLKTFGLFGRLKTHVSDFPKLFIQRHGNAL